MPSFLYIGQDSGSGLASIRGMANVAPIAFDASNHQAVGTGIVSHSLWAQDTEWIQIWSLQLLPEQERYAKKKPKLVSESTLVVLVRK